MIVPIVQEQDIGRGLMISENLTQIRELINSGDLDECPVCEASGQMLVTNRMVCPDCRGRKTILNENEQMNYQCNRCDIEGTVFHAGWKTCTKCKGTRMWIDFIKRPSPKEKELDICLG